MNIRLYQQDLDQEPISSVLARDGVRLGVIAEPGREQHVYSMGDTVYVGSYGWIGMEVDDNHSFRILGNIMTTPLKDFQEEVAKPDVERDAFLRNFRDFEIVGRDGDNLLFARSMGTPVVWNLNQSPEEFGVNKLTVAERQLLQLIRSNKKLTAPAIHFQFP
jgi:hypothetical protein